MQGEHSNPAAVLEHLLQRDRMLAMARQIPLLAVIDEADSNAEQTLVLGTRMCLSCVSCCA